MLKNIYKLDTESDPESVGGLNDQFMKRISLEEAFRGGPSQIFADMISIGRKKFNEMTNDRALFHYDDLFRSDSCPFPEHSHREDEWLMLVEQSWCDYDENGYRKFEVPEGCE